MKVLCFAGEKRSGKDTGCILTTELLNEAGYKVQRIALADTMKEITSQILNISIDKVEAYKNNEDWSIHGIGESGPEYFTNMRGVLQNLGQHLKHYFGNNVWFDLASNKIIDEEVVYIVTDIRFPFELDLFMKKFGAWSIKIERDLDRPTDTHESEAFINDIITDHIIDNNGTLDEFKERLRDILIVQDYL
jgi:hypothetical protein